VHSGRSGAVLKALLVLAGCLVVAGIVWGSWLYSNRGQFDGVIGDEAFVEEANRICESAAEQGPEPAGDDASMAERAGTVEEGATVFGDMVQRLRALPVAREDQKEVEDWLDRWEELITVGHRYADAIRAESPEFEKIGNEGDAPAGDVNTFARDNGIHACVF
jgi:hypothetical protein